MYKINGAQYKVVGLFTSTITNKEWVAVNYSTTTKRMIAYFPYDKTKHIDWECHND